VGSLKLLLVSALVLSVVCLVLAVYHWMRLRSDQKGEPKGVVSQRPMWLEFPRAYTHKGRHHQRRFFVYFVVFVVLFIVLFVVQQAGGISS
jgi:F0F1-type ATP synthase membrane subunit a